MLTILLSLNASISDAIEKGNFDKFSIRLMQYRQLSQEERTQCFSEALDIFYDTPEYFKSLERFHILPTIENLRGVCHDLMMLERLLRLNPKLLMQPFEGDKILLRYAIDENDPQLLSLAIKIHPDLNFRAMLKDKALKDECRAVVKRHKEFSEFKVELQKEGKERRPLKRQREQEREAEAEIEPMDPDVAFDLAVSKVYSEKFIPLYRERMEIIQIERICSFIGNFNFDDGFEGEFLEAFPLTEAMEKCLRKLPYRELCLFKNISYRCLDLIMDHKFKSEPALSKEERQRILNLLRSIKPTTLSCFLANKDLFSRRAAQEIFRQAIEQYETYLPQILRKADEIQDDYLQQRLNPSAAFDTVPEEDQTELIDVRQAVKAYLTRKKRKLPEVSGQDLVNATKDLKAALKDSKGLKEVITKMGKAGYDKLKTIALLKASYMIDGNSSEEEDET